MHDEKRDAQAILDAGMAITEGTYPAGHEDATPYVILPEGATVQGLENLLKIPSRIRQVVTLHDPESFIEYVQTFKDGDSAIFFHQDKGTFKAILDYHAGYGEPNWCSHVATFTARQTPEWKAWRGSNGCFQDQATFAKFIEDRIDDIANSYGDTLLKIALNLEIHKDVSFVNHKRMEDGSVKLQYEEEIKGTAAVGQITIPPAFQIFVQPYVGSDRVFADCRFRYRLQDRKAILWYELVNLDKIVEAALGGIRATIDKETGIKAYAGE